MRRTSNLFSQSYCVSCYQSASSCGKIVKLFSLLEPVIVLRGYNNHLQHLPTCCSGCRDVGDIGVVVEAGRVIIDVSDHHRHGGRAGQALWLPSICCYNQQLVIGPVFSVQQGTGDNLACSRVDRELAMSSSQTVTVGKKK